MYGHKRVRERRNDALTRVGWEQLEVLLATWYRGQGYEVEHTGTGASGSEYDGGIDLKLRRPGEYLLVQVKHWNAYKVPHNDVHQLLGLMVNEGATGAILVTSGEFTKAAIEAATRHGHVRLIDGDKLRAMLGPLPESVSTSPLAPIAARAGERLLLAAEDRIRHGRRPRRGVQAGIGLVLLKGAFALAVMLFGVWAFNSVVRSIIAPLSSPPQASSIQATRLPAAKSAAIAPAAAADLASTADSCEAPGASVDRCAQAIRRYKPTAAEIRQSQRKAEEAIQVLAPNTPEM